MINLERYQRQLALPEISPAQQKKLGQTNIVFIGAGGLGAPALPYLAAAGIGKVTVIDNDTISISNLHRQTVYKTSDKEGSKAEAMANYLRALNPEIEIHAIDARVQDVSVLRNVDLIMDGSDNFETKSFLNEFSIRNATPLISASVNQWVGQCGIFAGYLKDAPCYHCLFPELPANARNCNEAGILGTSAGLAGTYEAHLALLYLLEIVETGTILTMDFKSFRLTRLQLNKNPDCTVCKEGQAATEKSKPQASKMADLYSLEELKKHDYLIVDVRTTPEIIADPVEGALHIELTTLPTRHEELPKDKLLAFVCAGNIRSAQAAQYLAAIGYDNVCVLDKFSL
jgi:molybdopterin/thiamine biosynthesis adenylyltransferase/rhodanese-related sulfurtransferase